MSNSSEVESIKTGNEILPPWRWGILRRKECSGELIQAGERESHFHQRNIYKALRDIGYRETYWQYVYVGQIGGLIFNPRGGLIEHHVRFYADGRIYAEIEFGRSAILHFLNRRLYLNNYITSKICSRISMDDHDFLENAVKKHKQISPYAWPEWGLKNRFYTQRVKQQIKFLAILGDWRFLTFLMFSSFAVTTNADFLSPVVPLFVALMIIVYFLAPKRS